VHEVIKISDSHSHHQVSSLDGCRRVSAVVGQADPRLTGACINNAPLTTTAEFVRQVLAARAARRKFFASELFSDPAWDFLLELYAFNLEQRRISVSKLSVTAAVPKTTALRWIEKLEADGLIERSADPLDARRAWVSISAQAVAKMQAYLSNLPAHSLPL
jgi:DNA-binding MarR family transcriptional regulator